VISYLTAAHISWADLLCVGKFRSHMLYSLVEVLQRFHTFMLLFSSEHTAAGRSVKKWWGSSNSSVNVMTALQNFKLQCLQR